MSLLSSSVRICSRSSSSVVPVASRFFHSSSSPLFSPWQKIAPKVAAESVSHGKAVFLDVRPSAEGISLPDAISIPYESFVGSDRGAEPPATFKREDLLAALTPEQLGSESYHAFGNEMLAVLKKQSKNTSLTHDQAKALIKTRIEELKSNPKQFLTKIVSSGNNDTIKKLSKKMSFGLTPTQAQYINRLSESLKRYLSYNPSASKEELASQFSNDELAYKSGLKFPNLTSSSTASSVDAAVLKHLPTNKELYIIDFVGVHSARVADRLSAAGFDKLFVVDGGLDKYITGGNKVVLNAALQTVVNERLAAALKSEPQGANEIND